MKFWTTQLGPTPSTDLIFETSVWFYFDLLLFLLFIYLFIFICCRNIYRLPITLVYGCWCKRPMHSLLIYIIRGRPTANWAQFLYIPAWADGMQHYVYPLTFFFFFLIYLFLNPFENFVLHQILSSSLSSKY